jgi:chorismate synthase
MHFRFLTAGESHGKGLMVIIDGMPAGLELSEAYIAGHLRRRQQGYGRGKRQQIETDRKSVV